jgi:hypothetical protein
MLDILQSHDFLPYLHQTFCVHLSGGERIELELESVVELGQAFRPGSRAPFSIHFLGPPSKYYLQQQTCRLEHEHLGSLDLFIVPLGPEAGRMRYEAIFT